MRITSKHSPEWRKMFAYLPHRTLEGEWVWLRGVYIKCVGYRYKWCEEGPIVRYTLTPEKYKNYKIEN